MGLGLFLVSTRGGYWFLTHLYFTRYGALRDSGYKQELAITTNFAPVIWRSLEGSSGLAYGDFRVVIPMTEIMTARMFLPEAYELFRQ